MTRCDNCSSRDHPLFFVQCRIDRRCRTGSYGQRCLPSLEAGLLQLYCDLLDRGVSVPFTSTLVLRMRCSRVRRFLSPYPTFDLQLSTVNLPARVFLRFLTPYLAVHDHLSSPHPVQPSAEIPFRISCFRLSTVDC